jgi:hypothetical protein
LPSLYCDFASPAVALASKAGSMPWVRGVTANEDGTHGAETHNRSARTAQKRKNRALMLSTSFLSSAASPSLRWRMIPQKSYLGPATNPAPTNPIARIASHGMKNPRTGKFKEKSWLWVGRLKRATDAASSPIEKFVCSVLNCHLGRVNRLLP